MERITIGISEDLWAELLNIKAKNKIRSFDDVIKLLLNNYKENKKKNG